MCCLNIIRSFLRRCRHFELEESVGSAPSEAAATDYTVNPKDLLSFAWQICKGMSYLTDMKVKQTISLLLFNIILEIYYY